MTPDEQLNVLRAMWKKQENVEIGMRKEDIETIKYYLKEVSLYSIFDVTLLHLYYIIIKS